MARKPKTQPSADAAAAVPMPEPAAPDEAALPARRGRKPKAVALLSASPSTASTDGAKADVPAAAPTKAPGRRGPGRKPKQAAGAEVAPSIQDGAAGPQDQAPREHQAEADSDLSEDEVPMGAAASQAEAAADSDPARSASEAAQSIPETEASVPAAPAAHWDRTTDRVQFDWPVIGRAAAQDGPNQGMAKLLMAAWAEGAQSRWPF